MPQAQWPWRILRGVTATLCGAYIEQELAGAREKFDATRYEAYEQTAVLVHALIQAPKFRDFLPLPAYA